MSNGKKIAVLGGGLGGMSCAWELAHAPEDYDITVYQLGWRLGGKGASGRNLAKGKGKRIEEHGIHVFSGLYDNAFRMMRGAYDELERAPDAPLGTWLDAFKPHNVMVVEEEWKGEWLPWIVETPVNEELPGEDGASLFLDPSDYVYEALYMFRGFLRQGRAGAKGEERDKTGEPILPIRGVIGKTIGRWFNRDAAELFLFFARLFAKIVLRIPLLQAIFLWVLKLVIQHIWAGVKDRLDETEVRRFWLALNFLYGNTVGSIKCNIFEHGVDHLDQYDYLEWLGKYILDDTVDGHPVTLSSPIAMFIYDAEFAYVGGDDQKPNIGAGSALRTILRMGLTWKGSLLWEMQAGMGDTIFGPLYEVLKKRGVKFEFFHQLTDVRVENDEVIELDIKSQVELITDDGQYHPLVDVNGLPCWPSEPLWDQLKDGAALKAQGVDFESYFAPGGTTKTLKKGDQFDEVVLALSIGGLPYCAGSLIEASDELKDMVDNVQTVRTQSAQFWCKPTTYELGWETMGGPIFSCFGKSLMNSWADFSHLISRESWPPEKGNYPTSIQYWCGPMLDDPFYQTPAGPMQKPEYLDEARGAKLAEETALALFTDGIGWVWPRSVRANGEFDMSLLINEPNQSNADPFGQQFFRGNVTPTERFVLTLAGTLQYRRYPDQTGFENLVFAGDWTRNDFNIGNVEASVMSGMLAANAISGLPNKKDIVGFGFLSGNLDTQGKSL